jgi:hypothetical protein
VEAGDPVSSFKGEEALYGTDAPDAQYHPADADAAVAWTRNRWHRRAPCLPADSAEVEYELTPFGATLAPVLLNLKEWGKLYQVRQLGVVTGASSRDELKPTVTKPAGRGARDGDNQGLVTKSLLYFEFDTKVQKIGKVPRQFNWWSAPQIDSGIA